MSFTQYCAGGLIRWVEQGFCTTAAFKAADRKGKELFDKKGAEQWETGVSLFSTLQELQAEAERAD